MKVAMILTDEREEFHQYDNPVPFFGPAPTALLQGLTNLPEIEFHIVSCTKRPMSTPEKLSQNVWFHLLHVNQWGWLRSIYSGCVLAIRRKLREIQPHLVHGQGTERYCSLAAVLSGFPNIITIHGNMRPIAKASSAKTFSYLWSAAKLEQFVLPRTFGVVCNSRYTESMVSDHARKTWRVPNALREEFFAPPIPSLAPARPPILLNIGTISRDKRQVELLAIAEELYQEGFAFQLQFIGKATPTNKYATAFLNQIAAAERTGFARYLGTKSLGEVIASLDAASALIHIPSEEAFGLVVAEALSRNLKFFGTMIGGIPDIAEGVEGVELFPLNDERSLRVAIAKWLRKGCPRPLSAALEMRTRYHPNVVGERHAEIYREFVDVFHH